MTGNAPKTCASRRGIYIFPATRLFPIFCARNASYLQQNKDSEGRGQGYRTRGAYGLRIFGGQLVQQGRGGGQLVDPEDQQHEVRT